MSANATQAQTVMPPWSDIVMIRRPVSPELLLVVRWMLDHARTQAGVDYSPDLDKLEVIEEWDCNSFDFEPGGPHKVIIADARALWPDGAMAGLILWGQDGRVQGLETYEGSEGSHRRLAYPDILQPYGL
jgi:hypothetical protein